MPATHSCSHPARRLLRAASVATLLLLAACGSSVPTPAPPSPAPGIGGGPAVYSDDFTDARSGWFSGQIADGTAFTYLRNTYLVTARHAVTHPTAAHSSTHLQQAAIDVTTLVDAGNPATAGAGVWCFQGDATPRSDVYLFIVFPNGVFAIERHPTASAPGTQLVRGTSPLIQGIGSQNRLTAACRTVSWDGRTAHNELVLALDGSIIAHVHDTWTGQLSAGWGTGVLVFGDERVDTAVHFSHYRVRDLAGA